MAQNFDILFHLVSKLYAYFLGLERQMNVEEDEDLRGFNLSPAHPFTDQDYSNKGDNSHKGADNSYYGSSSHRGGDSSYRGGFDTSHTEETEMYRPVIEVVSYLGHYFEYL